MTELILITISVQLAIIIYLLIKLDDRPITSTVTIAPIKPKSKIEELGYRTQKEADFEKELENQPDLIREAYGKK